MASSFRYAIETAYSCSAAFKNAGYDTIAVTSSDNCYSFDPDEWENQQMVSYQDHGSPAWAGISYSKIPYLDNSLVFNDACSTCSTHNSDSFCNIVIRKGGLGHMGAVSIAWAGNKIYKKTMDGIYYDGLTLGESFTKAYEYNRHRYMTTLFGDPTLDLNAQYTLEEKLPW